MFGSSFGASLPSSGGGAASGSSNLFPKSDFGITSNNNKTDDGPSLPFAGFGSVNSKPSNASNKSLESGGFNFGGTSTAGVGDSISSAKTNLFASTSADTTNKSPPATSSSTSLPISGFGATKSSIGSTTKTNTSSFSGAASKAAASASKNNSTHHMSNIGNSSALVPTLSTSTVITTTNNNNNTSNYNNSLENSCISPNGRSFHSYLYDTTLQKHVIVSEFAPFGETTSSGNGDDNITPRDNNNDEGVISSALKITTVLPILVQESIAIDNVIGLLCVDGNNDNDRSKQHIFKQQQQGEEGTKTLPTLCLYTSTSVFILTIGYTPPDDDQQKSIQGKIIQSHEPFEKQLLMSPSNSSIIRIRSAPQSNSMFSRNGSIAMLLREGGKDDTFVGYVVCLYHGLPADGSQSGKGGEVTTPLRFNYQDLVRGLQDTVDAENAAYNRGGGFDQPSPSSKLLSNPSSKSVVDFCFNSSSSGFSSTSILVLCNDGSVYGASPIIFDGAVLPRTTVMSTICQLNDEIEASSSYLQAMSQSTPAPTTEHEGVEARLRQCRAARRYLLDVFGIPDGMITGSSNASGGSYYVSASVVHTKSYSRSAGDDGGYSQALSWQPRLQGPLIMPPEEQSNYSYSCIESFGGTSASIIDGFVVARTSKGFTYHVEVGILPGGGAVILPRFEFESDGDCQLIDDIVRGTGMYVESASIMNDVSEEESGESMSSTALTTISSNNNTSDCSIVVDPLDDIMLHLVTNSRIVTVTTNAVAVTANCFKSRADGTRGEEKGLSTIRTKVWSELEVSLANTTLVGACVSGDVHLGHIMLARVSNGSMEVVNITATQCLYETSEQIKAKSEELEASVGDDAALEVLKKVKPLHEILQPLIDKVCNGLSKMGKVVGSATLPKDAGPENLATFLETQHSCEVNVIMPLEEMSKILSARRELLTEMYNHQSSELVRLTSLLDEFKSKYESNLKRVVALESKASMLAERSSAVLTATRELRPTITDAEAAYFKDLQRYETSCNKWESSVSKLEKESTTSCEAMSAGAIENGDVRCLVDLSTKKIEVCHQLLGGEAQILKTLEQKVKEASDNVEQLSKAISGVRDSEGRADKENQRS